MILNLIAPWLAALAYLIAALRLACYHRGTSRYRRLVSLSASMLGAALCLCGLEILLYRPAVGYGQAACAVVLCLLVLRCRGNVAALFKPAQ